MNELQKLEELEKTKSPVEEAYKRWMGEYPLTGPSVDGIDDIRWRAFQMGYNADYEEQVAPPTPQTPEQGVVSSTKSKTLTDLIERWWCDVFTIHSDWDMETSIDDLVDRIQLWLPKEQSAAGSQNAYVECTVEGFNDCVNKIKDNLR